MRGFILPALAAAALLWTAAPRHPNLTGFDADRIAERETAMWRDYYAHAPFRLFARLYEGNRDEFGFSPLDSFLLALDAARAARAFQPTRSRAEAQVAEPLLESYYARLAPAAAPSFDPRDAARRELDWWQARREAAEPRDFGATIGKLASLVYGRDNADIAAFGLRRAEAMAFRDARGAAITEADWREIADRLRAAYRALARGLSSPVASNRSS